MKCLACLEAKLDEKIKDAKENLGDIEWETE